MLILDEVDTEYYLFEKIEVESIIDDLMAVTAKVILKEAKIKRPVFMVMISADQPLEGLETTIRREMECGRFFFDRTAAATFVYEFKAVANGTFTRIDQNLGLSLKEIEGLLIH